MPQLDLLFSQSTFKPFRRMGERLEATRTDSDAALFFDLLYAGEMVAKVVTAGVIAAIQDDRERHRYRLEHRLVRANGIGEWIESLDDAIVGPASQQLVPDARPLQRELTSLFGAAASSWQFQAVADLHKVCRALEQNYEQLPPKVSLRRWFALFAWLRNRTRGHGALTPAQSSSLCEPLFQSIASVVERSLTKPLAGYRRRRPQTLRSW